MLARRQLISRLARILLGGQPTLTTMISGMGTITGTGGGVGAHTAHTGIGDGMTHIGDRLGITMAGVDAIGDTIILIMAEVGALTTPTAVVVQLAVV